MWRTLLSGIVLVCISVSGMSTLKAARSGQTSSKPNPRALVQAAIDRMGGADALRAIVSVRFTSAGYRNMLEQSERPEGPWIPSVELTTEEWDLAARRANIVNESRAGEFTFKQRQVIADGVVAQSFDGRWGPGSPAALAAFDERVALSPFRAVLAALDATDLRAEGDRVVQGVPHHVVSWTSPTGPRRLLLNAHTGYPTTVETVSAYPDDLYWQVWGDVTVRVSYSYWSIEADGVRLPRQWDVEKNGLPDSAITIQSLELSPAFAADAFAMPDDARKAYAGRASQTLDRPAFGSPSRPPRDLAPGVVEIPSSWDITLVKQDDGIVVIEAPISAGYSARVIEEARARFPGVPVKAAISTSDSWPHFGGVREYVARGIPVYILDLNRPILARALSASHAKHPDALQSRPKAPDFRIVTSKTVVGRGPNRLELYPVRGETGERMMAVYFPEHHLLYGSDLVQWGRGGPPEYVSELLDLATRENLTVETVFAMHADPSPWSRVVDAVAKAGAGKPAAARR